LQLLARQILQRGKLSLMQVAVSFAQQHLIAHAEAEGAGLVGHRRAARAAGKIMRRLDQRRRGKALGRPGRKVQREAESSGFARQAEPGAQQQNQPSHSRD